MNLLKKYRAMKRIGRNIILSRLKSCSQPNNRPVQKLISAEVFNPCTSSGSSSGSYKSPRPVAIRICTRKDVERTLPLKVSYCPENLQKDTVVKKIRRLVKNLFKGAIATGLVYWTSTEGFWGDGKDAEDLYERIITTVAPAFEEVVDLRKAKQLPHLENIKYKLLDGYNRTIFGLIDFMISLPITLRDKITDIFENEEVKNPQVDEKK